MLAEISSFTAALATAKDLGAALLNERDRQKAAAIQIDLTDKIVQAQAQLTQILGTVIEKDGLIQTLSQRVRELEAKQAEKSRYQLAKVGTAGQFFAYALRPSGELAERTDEPAHFLCQSCFDADKKSVLQIMGGVARCPVCDSRVQIEAKAPARPRTYGTGIDDSFARRD